MKKLYLLVSALLIGANIMFAQLATPALSGYWHNWNDSRAPYYAIDQTDSRYGIVQVAFALPRSGTDYDMVFTPDGIPVSQFTAQVRNLQAQGRKVFISVGGATAFISLSNVAERNAFVQSMLNILQQYGFDGMDINLEGGSLSVSGGTITQPVDLPVIYMIDAIRSIMQQYAQANGRKLLLSMAPETAYVQGGMSGYGGVWGAYLPLIHALRDSIDLMQVQLYNSGTMYGIDRRIYTQGTPDFIVAMTEAVIRGFQTNGGFFQGLPAHKVAVALPACSSAAGGGFVAPAQVQTAVRYLKGEGPRPGQYILQQSGGYSNLGGMMTWSINWDRLSTCGAAYEYAANYALLFGNPATCTQPGAPSVSGITHTSAAIHWAAQPGATGYKVYYRRLDGGGSTVMDMVQPPAQLQGLQPGTAYAVSVEAICAGGPTGAGPETAFTTTMPIVCLPPGSLQFTQVTANGATALWQVASDANSYEFQHRASGTNNAWVTRTVNGLTTSLTGLKAATTYEARLRTRCSDGSISEYGAIQTFTTQARGKKAAAALPDESFMVLYPNPARDRIRIVVPASVASGWHLTVTDMQGRQLASRRVNGNMTELDVSQWSPGIYRVDAGGRSARFVVQR